MKMLSRLRQALALSGGSFLLILALQVAASASAATPVPCLPGLDLVQKKHCAAVRAMLLPESLPPARGNAYGDSLAAAKFGFQVFFDPRFSLGGQMRCATCHVPETAFHDRRQVSLGRGNRLLPRNSPTLLTAAWTHGDFFWDGRADSLWSQPLFAFESPEEMATTRLDLAHTLSDQPLYHRLYVEAFGLLPDLSDKTRFPPSGRPGDRAFDAMAEADKQSINRIVANLGKALEAYMRKLATGRSRLDRYLLGQAGSLDSSALEGLSVFVKVGCATCHSGPTLSDDRYHDMGVPALPNAAADIGRAGALPILAANPFNRFGVYYDRSDTERSAPLAQAQQRKDHAGVEGAKGGVGKFRTQTLRNISMTAPYGHNGYYATLSDLLAHHGPVRLTPQQADSIQIFLLSLRGIYPERPWNNWPSN